MQCGGAGSVAVGCVAESEVAMRIGGVDMMIDPSKIERIANCFLSYGLPIHVPRGCAPRKHTHLTGRASCGMRLSTLALCARRNGCACAAYPSTRS